MSIAFEPVIVKLDDGETLTFKNASEYGTKPTGMVYVKVNGIDALFNSNHVKYIGRYCDLVQ